MRYFEIASENINLMHVTIITWIIYPQNAWTLWCLIHGRTSIVVKLMYD